jgi:hypothetical protein
LIWLKPNNPIEVQEGLHLSDDEVKYGSGGKLMAKNVQVGDNLEVKC